jgi:hypothetical protein
MKIGKCPCCGVPEYYLVTLPYEQVCFVCHEWLRATIRTWTNRELVRMNEWFAEKAECIQRERDLS